MRRRARTLAQGVAVHDGGDVAEEVLAAVGLRWGNDASFCRSHDDRYVIRTRNLQDWNLTRYRCANRSLDEYASGGVRTHASGEIGA